jgi:hypothetical protein
MVQPVGLPLISKLRSDAALYDACVAEHKKRGPKPKHGAKIELRKINPKYLKETSVEDRIRTEMYPGQFFNNEFVGALNTVSQAHVILFSTDLDLAYDKMIKLYSLRFQLEFNFRDAKQ